MSYCADFNFENFTFSHPYTWLLKFSVAYYVTLHPFVRLSIGRSHLIFNFFTICLMPLLQRSNLHRHRAIFFFKKNYFSFLHIFTYLIKKMMTKFFKTLLYLFSSMLFNMKIIKTDEILRFFPIFLSKNIIFWIFF